MFQLFWSVLWTGQQTNFKKLPSKKKCSARQIPTLIQIAITYSFISFIENIRTKGSVRSDFRIPGICSNHDNFHI